MLTKVAISTHSIIDGSANFVRMLKNEGFEIELLKDNRFSTGKATDEEEIKLLRGVAAVIAAGERYPAHVIKSLPDLRVIARFGVGFDKVDVKAATANNVILTITPNSNYEAVAEHAITLIMSFAKSIVGLDKAMRSGDWIRESLTPIRGTTLGIVGLGRIGRSLATRARGMKMHVVAFEPNPDKKFVAENKIQLLDLVTLLKMSDYVSLNCALSNETYGIIDQEKLSMMKESGVLINTARGGLVVEKDLVKALKSGQIRGAGLDVFEIEPTEPGHPLYSLGNVVITPHVAGTDTLAIEDMGNEAAMCVIDLFNGRWPEGAVVNNDLKGKWSW